MTLATKMTSHSTQRNNTKIIYILFLGYGYFQSSPCCVNLRAGSNPHYGPACLKSMNFDRRQRTRKSMVARVPAKRIIDPTAQSTYETKGFYPSIYLSRGYSFLETKMSRPIFVGNFEYDTRQSELERLFSKYGRIERIDMKSGFAFVYYEDERDAQDAIRALDAFPFGYDRRKLSVEWAKGERGRLRDGSKSIENQNQRPTKTLFVINFDPIRTRERDITRHFEPYGDVLSVRIRRNFAFVQFANQEDATKALESTQRSKILDRVVSVEYALRDDDEKDERLGSPRRGGYGRRDSPYKRSPSPVYRRRPSPDYGRPRSPIYDRYNGPAYDRSPVYDRRRSPEYGRHRSPEYGRYRSRSPVRRSRT